MKRIHEVDSDPYFDGLRFVRTARTIQATGMVQGGRGRSFKVAKGQNLDLVPIEVSYP